MPIIPSGIECSVSIEPQYDGVVMLSSDVVFFNDAQPRPDGRKIYHIFEHSVDEGLQEDDSSLDKSKKDFDSRKNELFSKASEYSIQNIQQVLAKNGISMQDWYPSLNSTGLQVLQPNSSVSKPDTHTTDSSASASQYSSALPNIENQEILAAIMQQRVNTPLFIDDEIEVLLDYHNFKLYKVHQFYINFPADLQSSSSKSKLLKRLQKRGVFDIEYEPENFRITLKTLRSAQFILKILKKIDQNVFLLSTTYDLVLLDNESEANSDINTFFRDL